MESVDILKGPKGALTCAHKHTCEHTHRHVHAYTHTLSCSGICGLDPTASLHVEFSPSPDIQSSEPSHNTWITETCRCGGCFKNTWWFSSPQVYWGSKDLPSVDTNPNSPWLGLCQLPEVGRILQLLRSSLQVSHLTVYSTATNLSLSDSEQSFNFMNFPKLALCLQESLRDVATPPPSLTSTLTDSHFSLVSIFATCCLLLQREVRHTITTYATTTSLLNTSYAPGTKRFMCIIPAHLTRILCRMCY